MRRRHHAEQHSKQDRFSDIRAVFIAPQKKEGQVPDRALECLSRIGAYDFELQIDPIFRQGLDFISPEIFARVD